MHLRKSVLSVGLFASIAIAVACGSTTTTTETPIDTATPQPSETAPTSVPTTIETAPPPETSASAQTPPTPPKTWKEAHTVPEQATYMKTNVVPAMKPVFQEFDGKKYEKFGCATCHGPNNLPPPQFLPKLTLAKGTFAVTKDKAALLKFMMEKVTPAMTTAMGDKPFDPATKEGFGCGGCHVVDVK